MESCESEPRLYYEQIQNPMCFDSILDRIFSFMPTSTLAQCRLVCRQWRDLSERHFVNSIRQSSSTVQLADSASTLSFLSTFVQRNVELPFRPHRSPWSNFLLDFGEICPIQRQLFLSICGDAITRISISPGICIDIAGLLATLLRNTPQLATLDFSCVLAKERMVEYASLSPWTPEMVDFSQWFDTQKNSQQRSSFPSLWQLSIRIFIEEDSVGDAEHFFSALFQLMPQLQELRVFELDVGKSWLTDQIIPAIIRALSVQAREKGPHNWLRHLVNLQLPYLDTADIHRLHQLHLYSSLRLDTLWLASLRKHIEGQTLLSFLQGQAETLKKLVLTTYTARFFRYFPLDLKFYRLSTLVVIRVGKTAFVPDILKHFPNLTNLIIRPPKDCEDNKAVYCHPPTPPSTQQVRNQQELRGQSLFTTKGVCEKVSALTFCSNYERDELTILERLVNICPHVTHLELSVANKKALRLVFVRWQKLRRLNIRFLSCKQIHNMDSYFTGIEDFPKTFPSLALLQELRTLEIYVDSTLDQRKNFGHNKPDLSFLSDKTLHVIMTMSRLRELTINQSSISPSCLRILNNTLNLEKCQVGDKLGQVIDLKRQICDKSTEQEDKGARERMRRRPLSHDNLLVGHYSCCLIV